MKNGGLDYRLYRRWRPPVGNTMIAGRSARYCCNDVWIGAAVTAMWAGEYKVVADRLYEIFVRSRDRARDRKTRRRLSVSQCNLTGSLRFSEVVPPRCFKPAN
jgi:hypothetical protein